MRASLGSRRKWAAWDSVAILGGGKQDMKNPSADSTERSLPQWASSVLVCPYCKGALSNIGGMLSCIQCRTAGKIESGIVRFPALAEDPSVIWYKAVGGTRFH